MAKFDFNAISQPTLEVTLPDKKHSQLHLTIPKTSLVERLTEMAEELDEITSTKDENTLYRAYSLFAELMSCNQECRDFTADELKKMLNIEHLSAFSLEYIKFLGTLKREKN